VTWKFDFSDQTGNSSLQSHLEGVHKNEYLQLCEANGWENLLPRMKKEAGSANGDKQPGDPSTPRAPFSQGWLLKAMVNFIVADDQVRFMLHQYYTTNQIAFQSINVVECREFRDLLLLLRQDLGDKDIPHRTKIREAIITAWKSWFIGLKRELAVSITKYFL
jgi:hypothetical protein